jgi:outer membrane lipoprotein-sorting protein
MKRSLASLLVALLCLSTPAWSADAFTPAQLMQSFAANRVGRATFVERKYLSSLTRPLESSGELSYTAPARLEKRTIEPKPETLVIDGNTLSIDRDGSHRSISLASFPEVAAFTDSLRATLGGDLDRLQRDYRVILDGSRARWRLTLLPSDPKIATLVSRVTIEGHDDRIASFETLQADGNRSVTTITAQPGRP